MSTNYYAFGPFPGGNTVKGLHIGQAAAGWRFLWRTHPEQGITSLSDWRTLLAEATRVEDEYGREFTADEVVEIGARASTQDRVLKSRFHGDRLRDGEHLDDDGNAFCAHEFF